MFTDTMTAILMDATSVKTSTRSEPMSSDMLTDMTAVPLDGANVTMNSRLKKIVKRIFREFIKDRHPYGCCKKCEETYKFIWMEPM